MSAYFMVERSKFRCQNSTASHDFAMCVICIVVKLYFVSWYRILDSHRYMDGARVIPFLYPKCRLPARLGAQLKS